MGEVGGGEEEEIGRMEKMGDGKENRENGRDGEENNSIHLNFSFYRKSLAPWEIWTRGHPAKYPFSNDFFGVCARVRW